MRRSALTMLVLVGAAGLSTGCTTNPVTGRSQLLLLSTQQEIALGEEATPALIEEYGGEVASAPLRAYVEEVGQRLAAQTLPRNRTLPWKFIVLDSEIINAFALPGGKVFISMGLLARYENEAQLAATLAHEIGHVTAQHVDERVSSALVWDLGVTVLGEATESEQLESAARLFSGGYQLKFGRDQESESDRLALRYMEAAGYDPIGMLQVLEVLQAAGRGTARTPEFFSTHPHPETRLRLVSRLLQGPYAHTQSNPSYSLYEARFQQRATPYLPAMVGR